MSRYGQLLGAVAFSTRHACHVARKTPKSRHAALRLCVVMALMMTDSIESQTLLIHWLGSGQLDTEGVARLLGGRVESLNTVLYDDPVLQDLAESVVHILSGREPPILTRALRVAAGDLDE